jgi:hypothetical protein
MSMSLTDSFFRKKIVSAHGGGDAPVPEDYAGDLRRMRRMAELDAMRAKLFPEIAGEISRRAETRDA